MIILILIMMTISSRPGRWTCQWTRRTRQYCSETREGWVGTFAFLAPCIDHFLQWCFLEESQMKSFQLPVADPFLTLDTIEDLSKSLPAHRLQIVLSSWVIDPLGQPLFIHLVKIYQVSKSQRNGLWTLKNWFDRSVFFLRQQMFVSYPIRGLHKVGIVWFLFLFSPYQRVEGMLVKCHASSSRLLTTKWRQKVRNCDNAYMMMIIIYFMMMIYMYSDLVDDKSSKTCE